MNNSYGLLAALKQAGLDSRWLGDESVEIEGIPFTIRRIKVVRESDGALLAYLHEASNRPPTIIVADRISEIARAQLSQVDLAWLDRRGHLWIRTTKFFINVDVQQSTGPPASRVQVVFKETGFDVALGLLRFPLEPHGVNKLARQIGRSPGRVSEILAALRYEGLVRADNRPVIPELFWAVAEEWKPRWMSISSPPPPDRPERFRLSGTLGAIALGLPLVAGEESAWPCLYVADDVDLANIIGSYSVTSGHTGSEVAICPSRYGFTWESPAKQGGYSVMNYLVVALDLAQDRARGKEALQVWNPKEFVRVW